MGFTPMHFSKIEISTYTAKQNIEECCFRGKIAISVSESKIEMGWSDFAKR